VPASRTAGRMVAVRLTDVPLKVRRRYGARLHEDAVADRDLLLAAQLHAAVENPSDRLHWLPEAKVRKVLR
jgi:hypothetical protein